MTFLVSHPTGNTFVRALLEELHKKDLLYSFYTTIGFGNECSDLLSIIKKKRKYEIPDSKIQRLWYPELKRLLLKTDQASSRRLTDESYSKLDSKTTRELSLHSVKVIHAYEDGAYNTFKKSKELGIQCSYELPIAHWATSRRLLSEESERYPHWEPTLETTVNRRKRFLKEEELKLADRISCPSQFVLDSIPLEIRKNVPCQIVPFGSPGSPNDLFFPRYNKNKVNKIFKILFVGSMSQRKGLADLFLAMKLLKKEPIKLSILGQPSMPMEFYRKEFSDFYYYKPCSNAGVRKVMHQHDALVLPSIVEGRALVQQEALSCGLPIIVTKNAGGEDLIEENITGHLIPIRSPEKIAEKILSLISNRNTSIDMVERRNNKAKSYTWPAYAQRIIDINSITTEKRV